MGKIRLQAIRALAEKINDEIREDLLKKDIVLTKTEKNNLNLLNLLNTDLQNLDFKINNIKKKFNDKNKYLHFCFEKKCYVLKERKPVYNFKNEIYNKLLIETEFEKKSLEDLSKDLKKQYLSKYQSN